MERQEQSRDEWEREFIDVQHSLGPAEGLRASQIIAKKLSTSPAPIADASHLIRLILSGVLLVIGFLVFSSSIPYKLWVGSVTLVGACYSGVTAFRRKSKGD